MQLFNIFMVIFRVQLPDLQMIDARLDFSVNIVRATQQLCREIGKLCFALSFSL